MCWLADSPARGGGGGCKLIHGCVCFGPVTPNPACGSFSTLLPPALQACYFGNLSLTGHTWVCSLAVLLAPVVLNDQSAPGWRSLSTSWGPREAWRGCLQAGMRGDLTHPEADFLHRLRHAAISASSARLGLRRGGYSMPHTWSWAPMHLAFPSLTQPADELPSPPPAKFPHYLTLADHQPLPLER